MSSSPSFEGFLRGLPRFTFTFASVPNEMANTSAYVRVNVHQYSFSCSLHAVRSLASSVLSLRFPLRLAVCRRAAPHLGDYR